MKWNDWFYYRTAANLLDPIDFLTCANIEKLQHEADQVDPDNLPGAEPLLLRTIGPTCQVSVIDTPSALGSLHLEIHYTPDAAQANRLRDPPSARRQVVEVMTPLFALHPEINDALHGIWVRADEGDASVY